MTRNPASGRREPLLPTVLSPRALPAELDEDRESQAISARSRVSSVAWWTRDFAGDSGQVREARHWIEDLLPACDPLADLLLLASELCANAITHTRSGQDGGLFSVDVEWTLRLARVVIGDQGSAMVPAVGAVTDDATSESGRGLRLVDQLADGWATACHHAGRAVWVDVQWQARGGPPLGPPEGMSAWSADVAAMRGMFPGTTVWWGHQTRAWWAAIPGVTGASGLVSSPTTEGLVKVLADARPRPGQHYGGPSPSSARLR